MRPLIVTSISAGLGNQMFQYATARRLALKNWGELVLVVDEPEKYRLPVFRIGGHEVPAGTIVPKHRIFDSGQMPAEADIPLFNERKAGDLIPRSGTGALSGAALLYAPELRNWRGHIRLRGYWQDERYFADIRTRIRSDFSLKEKLDARSLGCLGRIFAGASAFFHVRRGDYLSPEFRDAFGVCAADYYYRALEILRARVPRVKIFVFSDDPGWAAQNSIGGAGAEIIDWNADAPERDLELMRACTHAVIANSSFSWWGAWLGERPESIIIAPKTWFKAVPEFRDIVPERWMRI
jgi:hypothetical protein